MKACLLIFTTPNTGEQHRSAANPAHKFVSTGDVSNTPPQTVKLTEKATLKAFGEFVDIPTFRQIPKTQGHPLP